MSRPRAIRSLALVAAVAVVFGAFDRSLALSSALGLDVSNVSSLWLAAAFAAGARQRSTRGAAVAGIVCLGGILIGYYGFMHFAEGQANGWYLAHVAARWIPGALLGGATFGVLGALWSRRRSRLAATCLGACFALEPVLVLGHFAASVRIAEIVAGAALTAALLVAARRRGPASDETPTL